MVDLAAAQSGNDLMIAEVSQVAMGLTGFAIVLLAAILLVLAIFMPWFVYKIASRAKTLVDQSEDLKAQAHATKAEQAKTNQLLREIIKAYGHEPEA